MLDQPLSQRLREIREGKTAPLAEPAPEPLPAPPPRTPLGRLLVEKGALSQTDLDRALERQRDEGGPLGQILLDMGSVTQHDLARTLTEQHGFDFSASLRRRLSAVDEDFEPEPVAETYDRPYEPHEGERYLVREPDGDPLHISDSFLDAADVAFEMLEERNPDRLEIVRARNGEFEHLWAYKREDEPAAPPSPRQPYGDA